MVDTSSLSPDDVSLLMLSTLVSVCSLGAATAAGTVGGGGEEMVVGGTGATDGIASVTPCAVGWQFVLTARRVVVVRSISSIVSRTGWAATGGAEHAGESLLFTPAADVTLSDGDGTITCANAARTPSSSVNRTSSP